MRFYDIHARTSRKSRARRTHLNRARGLERVAQELRWGIGFRPLLCCPCVPAMVRLCHMQLVVH